MDCEVILHAIVLKFKSGKVINVFQTMSITQQPRRVALGSDVEVLTQTGQLGTQA